jgi:hypothetical protein
MLLAYHWIEKKKLEGLADGNYRVEIYNYFMVSVFGWPDPDTRECCES